ncbi:MAG: LacI family DNA-binding transcriptional regulator [Solobacterium sp.]|nr:LacI family DNA-binding transcriptional regulator [Solobacterium sp.]
MATMSDVAKLAGVSRATVSIVINGQASERKIPDDTCHKVWQAVRKLNYMPNVNARRIKDTEETEPTVALLWPSDFRIAYMDQFLLSAVQELTKVKNTCSLVVRPYTSGRLEEEFGLFRKGIYNGFIIGAAALSDIEALDRKEFPVPVIVINRHTQKHSCVSSNVKMMADKAIELFRQRGYKRIGMIAGTTSAMTDEQVALMKAAAANADIELREEDIIYGPSHYVDGGIAEARKYCRKKDRPKALFCDSDYMALGFLHECRKHGLNCPEDYELLSVGLFADDIAANQNPSLSTITIPLEEMASSAVRLVLDEIYHRSASRTEILCDPQLHIRETMHG